MSLNVQYAIELATKCLPLNINWWEEVLHADDIDGYTRIKSALPQIKWTTGEASFFMLYISPTNFVASMSTRDTGSESS